MLISLDRQQRILKIIASLLSWSNQMTWNKRQLFQIESDCQLQEKNMCIFELYNSVNFSIDIKYHWIIVKYVYSSYGTWVASNCQDFAGNCFSLICIFEDNEINGILYGLLSSRDCNAFEFFFWIAFLVSL